MKQKEQSPDERIDELGKQLIEVLEKEGLETAEDHAVVLSALAFVTAAGCSSLAGDQKGALKVVAEGFVRTFNSIIARDQAVNSVTH